MAVVLGCLVSGAAALLLASSQDWLGLPEGTSGGLGGGNGAEVAPAARALGLVALAGVVAVPATRGVLRRIAGGALALAGVGAGVATALAEPGSAVSDAHPDASVGVGLWWALSLFGALCLVVAGVAIIWRCGRWPAMGSRYEAPGATRRDDAWAMLDRGEDPTARAERSDDDP